MKRLQRMLERSLGPAGVLGLALLAGCLAFYWGGVRPVAGEVAALRAELEQVAGHARREAPRQANPHEALARFYGRFAAPAEVLGALDAVFNAAAREQVALDAGEYRVSREQGARLARYQIVLPVKGSYRSIRRFVVRALNNVPGLALDDLALRRDSTTSANVEARVQLTLYMGSGQ
jgi:hypothetical protein